MPLSRLPWASVHKDTRPGTLNVVTKNAKTGSFKTKTRTRRYNTLWK